MLDPPSTFPLRAAALGLAALLSACGRGGEATQGWLPVAAARRVACGDHVGDGVAVRVGADARVRVDVPPDRSLRFFAAARGEGPRGPDSRPVLRITLDDTLLFESDAPGWSACTLPPAGRPAATLTFSVEGRDAEAAFLAPVIGPREPLEPEERATSRPDLVLFMADTFRADNLALYGGSPELAPELGRFSDRCVRFLRAWSPASWTLPAQASMMTGVHPPQHGVVHEEAALSEALVTIAEHLASFGYRTGAVTDAGFVSSRFGFDQGFEWYEENRERDLGHTLASARAFLASGDGRPTFLFVQTYRTHHPYRTGHEEDLSDWDAFMAREAPAMHLPILDLRPVADLPSPASGTRDAEKRAVFADLRAMYEEAVTAMDQKLGTWLAGLVADGTLANGYLLLTSDHGEAFGEHDNVWHGGAPWEELTRVPMLLYGHDLEPRDETLAATLLDLPATFAQLAGVPPAPGWAGHPLTALTEDRAVFSFVRGVHAELVSVVAGGRKLYALADPQALKRGEFLAAYDLSADPGEEHRLAGESWPAELTRSKSAAIAELCKPLVDPAARAAGEGDHSLGALGYSGD